MKVYLIRHAESLYNVGEADLEKELGEVYKASERYITHKYSPEMMDVSITENGVGQCEEARKIMEGKHVDIVIVSPLRRALETCWHIFKDHPSKPQIIVDPLYKEILESNCDIGNRLEESMKDFPSFDFSRVKNSRTWYLDTIVNPAIKKEAMEYISSLAPEELESSHKIGLRTLDLLKDYNTKKVTLDTEEDMKARNLLQVEDLKKYKGKEVAVVSHSENLKHFIGWKIKNCEVKEYVIQE